MQHNHELVLEQYKQTLGLEAGFTIDSLSDITKIAQKHFQIYPFTTLSIHLDHDSTLEPSALFQELIRKGHGLCYHHNSAFYFILNSLGIATQFISALVRKPGDNQLSLEQETHVGLLFTYQEEDYVFDPGFDGTMHTPMPLSHSASPDSMHCLALSSRSHYTHTLLEKRDADWVPLYDFDHKATPDLSRWTEIYKYISSPTYPFWQTMIYCQMSLDGNIYKLVNILNTKSVLQIFSPQRELLKIEEVSLVNPLQALKHRIALPTMVIKSIQTEVFNNPNMGKVWYALIEQHAAVALQSMFRGSQGRKEARRLQNLNTINRKNSMVRYNIALIPTQDSEQFIRHAHKLSDSAPAAHYHIGGDASIPHVSLCHFESTPEQIENIWEQVQTLACTGMDLIFDHHRSKTYPKDSGASGCAWVSLMPNHEEDLHALHLQIAEIVKKPLNMSYENYDPHLTLFNSLEENACAEFNHTPKVVPALTDRFVIALGLLDPYGQITKILHTTEHSNLCAATPK